MGRVEHSRLVRACPGERQSGDAAVVRDLGGNRLLAAIIDVTGHGFAASRTAGRIAAYLETCRPAGVATIMQRLDELLKSSEGAAVGLAVIDTESGRLEYAGVGNTVLRRLGDDDTRLVSRDGMVGVRMREPRCQAIDLADRDLVLMYTDGIGERLELKRHDGSRHLPTAQLAQTLIREFAKPYDDAGCIVVRYRSGGRQTGAQEAP
jgi:serine phosphatase RsbU (regulator of sigma subunit)